MSRFQLYFATLGVLIDVVTEGVFGIGLATFFLLFRLVLFSLALIGAGLDGFDRVGFAHLFNDVTARFDYRLVGDWHAIVTHDCTPWFQWPDAIMPRCER